ncbi:hypothetical protein AB0958_19255 [Streptomyces sp. NPDC006655]|uniref:hypothetical protein n=1 Tax=Streptomyces sp. NPDC006655 TaxID=3156898 RepID=UPI003452F31A
MTDLSSQVSRLRRIADELESVSGEEEGDPLAPHPWTLQLVDSRGTERGQLNYRTPEALELRKRIQRYAVEHDMQPGDVAALALDYWLRARGFPPSSQPDRPSR